MLLRRIALFATVMLLTLSARLARAQCFPLTCAQQGATCGQIGDGCGDPLNCGSCATNLGQTCSVYNHQCCKEPVPITVGDMTYRCGPTKNCGMMADPCGGPTDIQCGPLTCEPGQTCWDNVCTGAPFETKATVPAMSRGGALLLCGGMLVAGLALLRPRRRS